MSKIFLHQHPDFKVLIENSAKEQNIKDPSLCEKDYWIMHCLYSLNELQFKYEIKGGTSLSKGYELINRFSEDIDIRIEPSEKLNGFKVFSVKNHDDVKHRLSRQNYFDWIAQYLHGKIHGIISVDRDHEFDDKEKYRNGGIRLNYEPLFDQVEGLKQGILLEVGFDRTTPNQTKDISSWAYDYSKKISDELFKDNRSMSTHCYEPKYTFVEKLQAITRKYRLFLEKKDSNNLPANSIRHYYDLYQLIYREDVSVFIGSEEYIAYKKERFKSDNIDLSNSPAIHLSDENKKIFNLEYERSAILYYRSRPSFDEIITRLKKESARL